MTFKDVLFLVACLFTGVGRFFVPGHGLSWPGTYEAFAHLFIGGMIVAWCYERKAWWLWAVIGLTVFETVKFLTR